MMQTSGNSGKHLLKAPVIIGGLGGSGTRVIAEIVREGGLIIGHNLNTSLDNMNFAFTMESLPESVNWPYAKLKSHLDLFEVLQFGKPWTFPVIRTLMMICFRRTSFWKPPGGPFRYARYVYLRSRKKPLTLERPWGWKAPRTQLYLPALNTHFQNCKYIHVIRHGLDMAFSKNVNQLLLYGEYFGISASPDDHDLPQKQLEFWIRSNTRALSYCGESMPGRFLVVNYDKLCAEPDAQIERILNFCELHSEPQMIRALAENIAPDSSGRYKEHDLGIFTDDQLRAVEAFGFKI